MNWNNDYYHKPFSHLYIEETAWNFPITRQLLARFPASAVIPIRHYRDVFSSHRQVFSCQKQSPKLILAVKEEETLIYPGAPVCQSFGNQNFFYTSSIMNCLYDCEYCYLQGMYPSANLVVFVNLDAIFQQVESLLQKSPIYLCISYDTDLLALEGLFGYVKRWIDFARQHPDLTIECRTKSAYVPILPDPSLSKRFIFAWTLSPSALIQTYEHRTPSLAARLNAICNALEAGNRIRLCFDPMLRVANWQEQYQALVDTVFTTLTSRVPDCLTNGQVADVSLGTFRISKEYITQIRRNRPRSPLVWYPFQTQTGVCSYGSAADREMMEWMKQALTAWLPEERIFLWKEDEPTAH